MCGSQKRHFKQRQITIQPKHAVSGYNAALVVYSVAQTICMQFVLVIHLYHHISKLSQQSLRALAIALKLLCTPTTTTTRSYTPQRLTNAM